MSQVALTKLAEPAVSEPLGLFEEALAHFELWLLERQAAILDFANTTPDMTNAVM